MKKNIQYMCIMTFLVFLFFPAILNAEEKVVQTDSKENLEIEEVDSSITSKKSKDEFQDLTEPHESNEVLDEKPTNIDGVKSLPVNYSTPSILKEGMRHSSIIELKRRLNVINFDGIKETDYFGSFTTKRVKEFQSYYNLTSDGVVGSATNKKLNEVYNSPFKKGKRHDKTIEFKRQLNRLGYGPIKVTTLYGSYMEKEVIRFQKDKGLKPHGIIDYKTQKKLSAHLNTVVLEEGVRSKEVIELKKKLNKLKFGKIKETEYYGSFTTTKVKEYQSYYGLKVTGVVDKKTMTHIDENIKSPYQKGKRNNRIKIFKQQLNNLGYGPIKVTTLYGSYMEKQVIQFQQKENLKAHGIIDKKTLNKIEAVLDQSYTVGNRHVEIKKLKQQLNKLGYGPIKVTSLYGVYMEKQVLLFQRKEGLQAHGLADNKTIDRIEQRYSQISLGEEKNVQQKFSVTFSSALNKQMNQLQQTDKYRNSPAYVSSSSKYIDSKGLVKTTLNVRADTTTDSHIYGQLKKGSKVKIVSKHGNWYEISYSTWRNPTRKDVEYYLEPKNNDKFQHLALDKTLNVEAVEMNKVLKGKGTLSNQAQAFINAGKTHQINESYLISHAILETGHGKSKLAQGVEVGKNKSGDLVLVTANNRNTLSNIKTTYNMFGIGAVDSNALAGGAIRAYQEDWTTPKKAIEGGAKFIGNRYIHNKYNQNTLYKMRWNPANPGYPQYATDIGWATKQVGNIKNIYQEMSSPDKTFYIINYK